jgi:hypothetical protein
VVDRGFGEMPALTQILQWEQFEFERNPLPPTPRELPENVSEKQYFTLRACKE